MFLLGQWKNFDDLEESVTLDELVQIFNSLTERENRRMEFQARMAGAEIKGDSDNTQKQASTEPNSLADRLRAKKQEKLQAESKAGKTTEFAQGVGHTVIGG